MQSSPCHRHNYLPTSYGAPASRRASPGAPPAPRPPYYWGRTSSWGAGLSWRPHSPGRWDRPGVRAARKGPGGRGQGRGAPR